MKKGEKQTGEDFIGRINDIDEILTREVTKFGNSAHIPVPSKHVGKEAKVVIMKKKKRREE